MLALQPGALLTINEVAQHLGVSQKTVRRWMREGKMPDYIDIHGQRRWRSEIIIGMVASFEFEQRMKKVAGKTGDNAAQSGTSGPEVDLGTSAKRKRD